MHQSERLLTATCHIHTYYMIYCNTLAEVCPRGIQREILHHLAHDLLQLYSTPHLDVQVHQLPPVSLFLAHPDEPWDVEALAKQLQVLHQLLWLELGIQDTQLGEDAHVCTLQTLQSRGNKAGWW